MPCNSVPRVEPLVHNFAISRSARGFFFLLCRLLRRAMRHQPCCHCCRLLHTLRVLDLCRRLAPPAAMPPADTCLVCPWLSSVTVLEEGVVNCVGEQHQAEDAEGENAKQRSAARVSLHGCFAARDSAPRGGRVVYLMLCTEVEGCGCSKIEHMLSLAGVHVPLI